VRGAEWIPLGNENSICPFSLRAQSLTGSRYSAEFVEERAYTSGSVFLGGHGRVCLWEPTGTYRNLRILRVAEVPQSSDRCVNQSERAATLWSVRSGVPGPNGAARALPTGGRETRGGRGAVAGRSRGGSGAVLDSRRVSPRRVPARVRFARVRHYRGLTAWVRSRGWWR